jgi:hypothetical protein
LLEAIAGSLEATVLDSCDGVDAQAQVWAAIGLLRNLATRVVEDPDIAAVERRMLGDFCGSGGDPSADNPALRRACLTKASSAADVRAASAQLLAVVAALAELDAPRRRGTNYHQVFAVGEAQLAGDDPVVDPPLVERP